MAVHNVPLSVTPVTGTDGSEQTILTMPKTGEHKIVALDVANVTAVAETLTIYIVPKDGAAGAATKVRSEMQVAANATQPALFTALVVAPESTIQVAASTASSLNVFGFYQVRTQ